MPSLKIDRRQARYFLLVADDDDVKKAIF